MKKISVMLLLVFVLILSACNAQEKSNDSSANESSSNDTDQLVLLEDKEAGIKITGVKTSSEMIGPITVHIGKTSHTYDWENVSNETYYPELSVVDLDNDQEQEFIILLTLGYGTGVKESEVHVIKKDFTEIPFPNPLENAESKIQDTVTKEGEGRVYTITVDGKSSDFSFKEDDAVEWFEQVAVGNSLSYRVTGQQIIAELSVQVSPGIVLGILEIPYQLVDGKFIEQPVQFIAFE